MNTCLEAAWKISSFQVSILLSIIHLSKLVIFLLTKQYLAFIISINPILLFNSKMLFNSVKNLIDHAWIEYVFIVDQHCTQKCAFHFLGQQEWRLLLELQRGLPSYTEPINQSYIVISRRPIFCSTRYAYSSNTQSIFIARVYLHLLISLLVRFFRTLSQNSPTWGLLKTAHKTTRRISPRELWALKAILPLNTSWQVNIVMNDPNPISSWIKCTPIYKQLLTFLIKSNLYRAPDISEWRI